MAAIARQLNGLRKTNNLHWQVDYIVAAAPRSEHKGAVKEIVLAANPEKEEGNVVLIRVAINKDDVDSSDRLPGVAVAGKIHCQEGKVPETERVPGTDSAYGTSAKPATGANVSPAAELKALGGQWKVVRVEEGKAADLSWTVFPYAYLGSPTFKPGMKPAIGDLLDFRNKRTMEIVTFSDGTDATFSYKIDPTSSPKTIDLLQPPPESQAKHRPGDEYQEGVVALGIYEIDGDRLNICLTRYEPSVKSDQRPKTLTIDANSGNTLFVLQRYRLSEDEQAMQGNSSITTWLDNGQPVPQRTSDSPMGRHYSFWGNTAYPFIDVHIDSHRYSGVPYVLEPSKQPKAITISEYNAFVSPPEKREWLEIYGIEGNNLTIAYRQNGPRPEKFESTPGSGVTLLVLEKPKLGAEKVSGSVSESEGSPEWFEAQSRLVGTIYLDQPEEARRILRLLIEKSPDLRYEVKGYNWLQTVARIQGKFDEMESIALKLQNIDLDSSRMPKEMLGKGDVYREIQNSQRSLMYAWAEMRDVPKAQREAKIRAFRDALYRAQGLAAETWGR
jgi:uncharacterized protein (TIGR03067 family)